MNPHLRRPDERPQPTRPKQAKNKPDKHKSRRVSHQPKGPNTKVVWFVVMFWPPVALVTLSLLYVLVNFVVTGPGGSAPLAAEPTWVDPVNFLITTAALFAFIGLVLNFAIGIGLYIKNYSRRS